MNAELEIPFKSAKDAANAKKVLESERIDRDRSQSKFEVKGSSLRISVSASDLPAFRASLSTYLRLLAAIMAGIETEG